jgi:molybdate transport system permease protein
MASSFPASHRERGAMDWDALFLSLRLGALTVLVLIPLATALGRWLAVRSFRAKPIVEAALALPLVLPPTVLGFYLLVAFGSGSWLGQAYQRLFGQTLVFSFEGLLIASVLVNIPFAVQPIQRAFEAIAPDLRDAAATCGMSWWRTLQRIELPLAWPGILTGIVLTFAHTLGEFGVVLMVGGSIPGETRTIAISIYDRVQAFDGAAAGRMAALLLLISIAAIALSYALTQRIGRRHA